MGKIGQNDSDFDFFQLRDYPESPGGAAGCSLGREPQVRGSPHASPLISTPAAAPTPGRARSWGGGRGGKGLGLVASPGPGAHAPGYMRPPPFGGSRGLSGSSLSPAGSGS